MLSAPKKPAASRAAIEFTVSTFTLFVALIIEFSITELTLFTIELQTTEAEIANLSPVVAAAAKLLKKPNSPTLGIYAILIPSVSAFQEKSQLSFAD